MNNSVMPTGYQGLRGPGLPMEESGGSTRQSLTDALKTRRTEMLVELRDVEQALEALEADPQFEGVFSRVNKILNRKY
jgi:hypothetical protein